MRVLLMILLTASAGCTAISFFGHVKEGTDAQTRYLTDHAVGFEVACDSCHVEYGEYAEILIDKAKGEWTGEVRLGTLRDSERVRVWLRAIPIGQATVLRARILLDGRTVAEREGEEPGEVVSLSRRVP